MTRRAGDASGTLIPALSPELARDWGLLAGPNQRSMRRRIGWVWGLLFFNVMTYAAGPTNLIPLPHQIGKSLPELALGVGLLLVLTANKKLLVRPNILLMLLTAMCLLSVLMSIRGYFGLGSMVRWLRFSLFVGALWLTTPWWGRRDFMILQFQRRALMVVIGTVIVGLAVSPTKAFAGATGGRLGGIVWPIQPTQVAHYSAVLVGITVVLWLAGASKSRWTGAVIVGAFGVLILTHSRIALVAMLAGVFVGGLSLLLSRKRVRRAFTVTILVAGIGALSFAPVVTGWFARGENSQALTNLTGRTNVWSAVLSQPRTETNTLLGYGLSNDGFDGIPIDSSWLSTYQDQGLVGDVLDGLVLVTLLIAALISPRGPGKAVALFLIVYCAVESFTQTGLGQPSADLLDLSVAMSLLMPPLLSTAGPRNMKAPDTSV
ncbi:MAG: O-antigen ligase family protein [Acidimicrobiales bacterium]